MFRVTDGELIINACDRYGREIRLLRNTPFPPGEKLPADVLICVEEYEYQDLTECSIYNGALEWVGTGYHQYCALKDERIRKAGELVRQRIQFLPPGEYLQHLQHIVAVACLDNEEFFPVENYIGEEFDIQTWLEEFINAFPHVCDFSLEEGEEVICPKCEQSIKGWNNIIKRDERGLRLYHKECPATQEET